MKIIGKFLLHLYRIIGFVLYPLIPALLLRREKKGKEHPLRKTERLGFYATKRPQGKLLWMHGASVGESLSMLPLITEIGKTHPKWTVLVTTGTVTSAKLMDERLPKNAIHQFVPVDSPLPVKRFFDHWQPDLGFWLESEFWPCLIMQAHSRNMPCLLLNGRVSNKTFAHWQRFYPVIAAMLNMFTFCYGQTDEDARRLSVLGANKTGCIGNIKFSAPPLPYDETKLANLQKAIGTRPCWLASSTHFDEENRIGDVHKKLAANIDNLLTIIVPRHPSRGEDIARTLEQNGLDTALRSANQPIADNTQIYIANTMGELGLFYRLVSVVFIGGSLIPHGGQNFLEPSLLDNAIVVGPHMHNFTEMTARAKDHKALYQAADETELQQHVAKMFANTSMQNDYSTHAKQFAQKEAGVLGRLMPELAPYLDKTAD